jgi:hypothetical protein
VKCESQNFRAEHKSDRLLSREPLQSEEDRYRWRKADDVDVGRDRSVVVRKKKFGNFEESRSLNFYIDFRNGTSAYDNVVHVLKECDFEVNKYGVDERLET